MPATLVHALPDAGQVARMLSDLVGRSVTCKAGKPVAPAPRQPVAAARFVGADGRPVAALLLDLPMAASAGAALVMLPPVVAADAVKAGALGPNIAENLLEVLNVCAGLFNSPTTPRVRFADVVTGEKLPDAVAALAKPGAARLDLEVAIPGYSGGRLSALSS